MSQHRALQIAIGVVAVTVLLGGGCRRRQSQQRAQAAVQAAERQGDVVVHRDVAYGDDVEQRLDVYAPALAHQQPLPMVLMVHGGGWTRGDKAHAPVAGNKVAAFVPRGLVFVSTNYRMATTPPDPLLQASDVAHALAFVQQHASEWGGDPTRVVLMGHSAGAHLVALLTAAPSLAVAAGAAPWIGTVSLDSGTLDVPATMGRPHRELFDAAFGNDPVVWQRLSPIHRLVGPPVPMLVPMLVVCSSQRQEPCLQGEQFATAARKAGSRVTVLPVDKSHAEINADLGISSPYTDAVIAFFDSVGAPLQPVATP